MSSSSHHAHEGVIIPIRDSTSGECVHLLPDDLPDEPNSAEFDAIMQVLQAELARPGVWVDLAEAYYRKGRPDIFKMVLAMLLEGLQQESVKEALREVVGDQFDQDMLRVYNKLAAQATLEAMEQKRLGGDTDTWVNLFDTAKAYFNQCDSVRRYAEETLFNQGWMMLNLSKDQGWRGADYLLNGANNAAISTSGRQNLLALLGLAIHAFHQDTPDGFRKGRKLFGEVIRKYPACPAEVRVGFGLCCYKLGELDRAKAAFQRALALSPGNRAALLALARTELVEADPETEYLQVIDRVVKMETAAYLQDEDDPVALNALATFYLHKWFPLPAVVVGWVEGSGKLKIGPSAKANGRRVDFERGDLIRVGVSFTARVLEVGEEGESLTLDRPFHVGLAGEAGEEEEEEEEEGGKKKEEEEEEEEEEGGEGGEGGKKRGGRKYYPLFRKNFKQAMELNDRVIDKAPPDAVQVRAEAWYLKARVVHHLDDFETALTYYQEACKEFPEMAPAQYGLAQMLAAQSRTLSLRDRKEEAAERVTEAVAALEKALAKVPSDPDALTLLGLLLAEQHAGNGHTTTIDNGAPTTHTRTKENAAAAEQAKTTALEKLKRAVDLRPDVKEAWLALAQVHQRDPLPDLKEALRCQLQAEKLMRAHNEPVPATLLSNMGALFHVKGEYGEAGRYYRLSLEAFAAAASVGGGVGLRDLESSYLSEEQPILHACNNVFWRWVDVEGMRVKVETGRREGVVVTNGPEGLASLRVGDHIRLKLGRGERDVFVTEVGEEEANGNLPFKHIFFMAPPEEGEEGEEGGGGVQVARKESRGLLRQETLTTVFNLGMIHMEQGEFMAATELFTAIMKQYPSYVAAYVQLGLLAQRAGHAKEAHLLFTKARHMAPTDRDVAAICGKAEQDAGHRDQAQKIFEPLNKEGDPYAMVALGNLYFTNSITVPDKAHHIGHARVYHSKVLKKHPRNLYAAHGLGLVLAEEYGKVDDARAVLQSIREQSGDKPDEILINIAHLFVAQGQRNAAIHCYETFLKKRPPSLVDSLYVRVLEFVAHAHYLEKEFNKGLRVMLKVFHLEPSKPGVLCNVAAMLEESALEVFKRANKSLTKTISESQNAEKDMLVTIEMYSRPELASTFPKARKRAEYLTKNLELARRFVAKEAKRLQEEKENKERQAAQVAAEMERREALKRAEEEEKEREREAARQAAQQREEELRKLTAQWAQEPKEVPKAAGGKKGKKGEILSEDEESEVDEPRGEGEEEEGEGGGEGGEGGEGVRRPPPELASSSEGESSSSDESSDDEAYGMRPIKKDRARAAAAGGGGGGAGGEGENGEAMDVSGGGGGGDEESRKRKVGGEEGTGGKKRRLQRAESSGSESGSEDELLFGSTATTPAAPAAAPVAAPEVGSTSSAAPPATAAASPLPEAAENGGGGGGGETPATAPTAPAAPVGGETQPTPSSAGRRKVVADDDEESDDE